jgi:uncharacterized membrane protein YfcA
MTVSHWLLYVLSGAIAGGINAVAGGGAILLFPYLLSLGLPPITANATMSLIVQPGTIGSAYGYRKHLRKLAKKYYLLLIPCFIGLHVIKITASVMYGKCKFIKWRCISNYSIY